MTGNTPRKLAGMVSDFALGVARAREAAGDPVMARACLVRAERWQAAIDEPDSDLSLILRRGFQRTKRPDCSGTLANLAENAGCNLVRRLALPEKGSIVTLEFSGELIAAPVNLAGQLADAALVSVQIEDGYGGCMIAAAEIIEAITGTKAPVMTCVKGTAASAHAIIAALAPGIRSIHRDAKLILHGSTTSTISDVAGLRRTADALEKLEGEIDLKLAARTGQDIEVVRTWRASGQDCTFTAEGAVAFGLMDAVGD